ncbi:MAG TPA: ethanolamine ammonia-lyase subunit EutC [Sulfurospirillum arcachonense]|nr:ethanolamine ammonia-lyase subunit EutC [Sulfurospirillum arcachonense]HIP43809.1 ethanolamine ammonia-lyase subunit EutC [Sulfurospirillum arcachonense]
MKSKISVENAYSKLITLTTARIGLGRSGISIPTHHLLDFQLAHAMAKDAVYLELDLDKLNLQTMLLHSKAKDRSIYLQRPDLGRRLDELSIKKIKESKLDKSYDLSIVIVDGLSSLAVHENVNNFIEILMKDLSGWSLAPICSVKQGRVAVGDEVGELLNAKVVIVLIGERPGLSSPDSLGMYLTWAPHVGLTDESRNCVSNIRLKGLSFKEAVKKTVYLLNESKRLNYSGVNLKDRTVSNGINQIKSKQKLLKL